MNYGILVNCNLPKDLKNIHNEFLKYLVLNPHITVCYIKNISLTEIEKKLSRIKKFKITFNDIDVMKRKTSYKIKNTSKLDSIFKIFLPNILAIPSEGYHMSIMYNPKSVNKTIFNQLKNKLPKDINVNKITIMGQKTKKDDWKKIKTIFLN